MRFARGCRQQHVAALVEARLDVSFVRKLSGKHQQDFIDNAESGARQGKMGASGRIKGGRQNAEGVRCARGPAKEFERHGTVVVYAPFRCGEVGQASLRPWDPPF